MSSFICIYQIKSNQIYSPYLVQVTDNLVGTLKLQDWTLTDDFAGVAIAGPDNGGLDIDGLDNGGLHIDGLDIAGLDIVGLDWTMTDECVGK